MFSFLRILVFILLFFNVSDYAGFDVSKQTPGPFLDGKLPFMAPGAEGSFGGKVILEGLDIPSPLRILSFRDEYYLILTKIGLVYEVNIESNESRIVLDIRDRCFKKGEAGSVGIAIHPDFWTKPEKRKIYLFYRTKPNPDGWSEQGFNRLSEFSWDSNEMVFEAGSEKILFQQYDRSTWHNGGGMFFKPDGFLYVALGDEGHPEFRKESTQRLDGGLFSGIIRIDVDQDSTRSHPIRRQPIANAEPPDKWGETYSQNYFIPNDNPWIDEEGGILEEFISIGIRSPYSTHLDKVTNKIWLLDVGSQIREEINTVNVKDNLQWPYKEGFITSPDITKPETIIGNEKEPIFTYDRSIGSAVIAGGIYRGGLFPTLYGKYIFADYVQNRLMALNMSGEKPKLEIIIANLSNLNITLPEKPGISGVHLMDNGEIILTVIGADFTQPGSFVKLTSITAFEEPSEKLSDLELFSSLENCTPQPFLIEYEINSPLWSDGSDKSRWIFLPYNSDSKELEKIKYREKLSWQMPPGSFIVKNFYRPAEGSKASETHGKPIETRILVQDTAGTVYGLSYKWNEEGNEAYLLKGGEDVYYDSTENDESSLRKWTFPSRSQCLTCHNKSAGYFLGTRTHQLNKIQNGSNQIEKLIEKGLLSNLNENTSDLPKSVSLFDENTTLEKRIRSYWSSNCATCHRKGQLQEVDIDLSYYTPLELTNTVNIKTSSTASEVGNLIIEPGNHKNSELWKRDNSLSFDRMPPLASHKVDQHYIDSLAKWIDGLNEIKRTNSAIFPNPSKGGVSIILKDKHTFPATIVLVDALGKIVFSKQINSNAFYEDFPEVHTGIYTIQIVSKSEKESLRLIFLTQ